MAVLKYSRQRESIINCLKGRKDHPTADMIYASVREEYPKISLGTVYRNLSLLVDQGEILRFSCGEGQDHYDADTSQHYHFVCKKCRAVSDLHMSPLEHIDVLGFHQLGRPKWHMLNIPYPLEDQKGPSEAMKQRVVEQFQSHGFTVY